MTGTASETPAIEKGRIYRDVYDKRIDERPAESIARLQVAKIDDDKLVFPGTGSEEKAIEDGVFFLEPPADLDMDAADTFSREFYKGPGYGKYGKFRDLGSDVFGDPLLGFHQRSDQIEQFLLERRFWRDVFPPEIERIASRLVRISSQILQKVLDIAGLPGELRTQALGGCAENDGSYHFTFNHYRPSHDGIGLSSHKDDGFLTILRTTAPGLEVNRAEKWEKVPVEPDLMIVNFGLTMEILTQKCSRPVSAILHRVSHQNRDRHSFGHFTSSNCQKDTDKGIFRFAPPGGLERVCDSRTLINANDSEIYEGTDPS